MSHDLLFTRNHRMRSGRDCGPTAGHGQGENATVLQQVQLYLFRVPTENSEVATVPHLCPATTKRDPVRRVRPVLADGYLVEGLRHKGSQLDGERCDRWRLIGKQKACLMDRRWDQATRDCASVHDFSTIVRPNLCTRFVLLSLPVILK
jgi:hypothetical protein